MTVSARTEPDALLRTIDLDVESCRRWRDYVISKGYIDFGGDDDSCWLWTKCLSEGYGRSGFEKVTRYAHRLMFIAVRGTPIPRGYTLDHSCRVHHCVNPDHLEPVTSRKNILRGTCFSADNARRTHCPEGHPLDEGNLRAGKVLRGQRCCLTCSREHARVQRNSVRDASRALGETKRAYAKDFGWSTRTAQAVLTAVQAGDLDKINVLRRSFASKQEGRR
jgi:hypothetical protein